MTWFKRFIIILLIIIIIDQLTKEIIRRMLMPFEVIHVMPYFNIVHISNKGAAFGIMSEAGNTFFIVMSLIAIIFIFYLLIINDGKNYIAYSFILAGAVGNLIDRILYGHVTDFLDFYIGRFHWPAFNVADSSLTIGICLFAINILFKNGK